MSKRQRLVRYSATYRGKTILNAFSYERLVGMAWVYAHDHEKVGFNQIRLSKVA